MRIKSILTQQTPGRFGLSLYAAHSGRFCTLYGTLTDVITQMEAEITEFMKWMPEGSHYVAFRVNITDDNDAPTAYKRIVAMAERLPGINAKNVLVRQVERQRRFYDASQFVRYRIG